MQPDFGLITNQPDFWHKKQEEPVFEDDWKECFGSYNEDSEKCRNCKSKVDCKKETE